MLRNLAFLVVLVATSITFADERENFFETKIRPVLVGKCFKCHGGEKVSSGLRVDSREALLKGGDSGTSVVVNKPEQSQLYLALTHDGDFKMPPDKKLPDDVLADFKQWIQDGAVWPKISGPRDLAFDAGRHWSFRPVQKPALPSVRQSDWLRTPIDSFILTELEKSQLAPSSNADRATLMRRLKFDLLGLPPTFEETQAFVADSDPAAYERLVEQYLAAPQYGERWARYWLDIARYADTKGYVFQEDRNYPSAYAYRDWVIRSLNEDLPYNEFLMRQLAADILVKEDGLDRNELAAMGFLTLGRRFLNNINDIIDDRLDVTIRGTMGITIGCARCHDHKFDPVPAADYYSLYGVFASSHEPKDVPNAMPLAENDKPTQPYVFLRGQAGNRGPNVPRQFLQVVAGNDRKPFEKASGRRELAAAITSASNPLTPRVIANRIWRDHFHTPLVRSTSDFGLRAEPPTHPELLDHLAATLIQSNWSLKALHRQIVLSNTYQQASTDDPAKRAIDSENRLFWRMNRGRLNLEAMRDAIIATSESLESQFGGKSVDIVPANAPRRRSVYAFIDRQNLPQFFRTFDFAVPDTHSPGRFETSGPQQSLFLRNSGLVRTEATRLAQQLPDSSLEERVLSLYRRVLNREPVAEEMTAAVEFIRSGTSDNAPPSGPAIWNYGYGEWDQALGQLKSFSSLPHFTGDRWQGGPQLPDPQTGWAMWHPKGGHPGNRQHAVVLRWVAPRDVLVRAAGKLTHPAKEGDGIRATVLLAGKQKFGQWTAQGSATDTGTVPVAVTTGTTVDFVVDCRDNENHDSFQWAPRIEEVGLGSQRWDSSLQFRGPQPKGLGVWPQLAQVLLLSNEFQFVD